MSVARPPRCLHGSAGLQPFDVVDETTQYPVVATVDRFCRETLSPYLNFHRPGQFPSRQADARGRERTVYRHSDGMQPYEKLRSLPDVAAFLRPGVPCAELDRQARAPTDREAAEDLFRARQNRQALIEDAACMAATASGTLLQSAFPTSPVQPHFWLGIDGIERRTVVNS